MIAPIALTMGEPAGIGGEITLKAWQRRGEGVPPFFAIDDPDRLGRLAATLGWDVPLRAVAGPEEAAQCFGEALGVLPRRIAHPVLMGREGLEKDRLGEGLKGAAPRALKDPEEDKALEIPRGAAHEGTEREESNRKDQVAFSPKEPAQPGGDGNDDRIRDKIGSDGPRGLVDTGGEAAADVIKGDIDDRGIDDLDERRQHNRNGNDPPIHDHQIQG